MTPTAPGGGSVVELDLDRFALSWHGRTVAALVREAGLVPCGSPASAPRVLPGAESGHLVAVSPGLLDERLPRDLVVAGGPCIFDCTSFPTLEALYDSVQALLLGDALGAPTVLYVGDREEALQAGGAGRWLRTGERVAAWLQALAGELGTPARVVRTSEPAHEELLERAQPALADVSDDDLDATFRLSSTTAGPTASTNETSRETTRRVIAAHLPSVAGAHAGSDAPLYSTVIIAENLQQSGVRRIADAASSRADGGAGGRVGMAAHWPTPGRFGRGRMYRCEPWEKLPAWDLETVARGELPAVDPGLVAFFAAWLDGDRRAVLSRVARSW